MKKSIVLFLTGGVLLAFGQFSPQQDPVEEQNYNQPAPNTLYVGRYGYWRNTPVKIAYASFLPSKGNDAMRPREFQLKNMIGRVVFKGKAVLMKNPSGVLAPVGRNFPGEQIYALDFSPYKQQGRYYITVPGYGPSEFFLIRGDMPKDTGALPSNKIFEEQSGMIRSDAKPLINDSFLFDPTLKDLFPPRDNQGE